MTIWVRRKIGTPWKTLVKRPGKGWACFLIPMQDPIPFECKDLLKRVSDVGGCIERSVELKRGSIFWPIVGLKPGGWWEGAALGSKSAQMMPKSKGPDLRQKLELGQTEGIYDGLFGQTNLLGILF